MINRFFEGVFSTGVSTSIDPGKFILCVLVGLVLGFVLALVYRCNTRYTKSFFVTLTLLPAAVCVVIMMVNGNIGAGVAVAGAFSLIRFRSVPGTAKEIVAVFIAMAAGLLCGMGYLGYAALFTLILSVALLVCYLTPFGTPKASKQKSLRITIPEDLDYPGLFDDLFAEYTAEWRQTSVKTTNMGSMFRLTYDITLKDAGREKELIDALRVRNGNLEIGISDRETVAGEM